MGGGKTRIGKRIRDLLVIAAITAVILLPALVYLGTVTAAVSHATPLYCNTAGGCPWTK